MNRIMPCGNVNRNMAIGNGESAMGNRQSLIVKVKQ